MTPASAQRRAADWVLIAIFFAIIITPLAGMPFVSAEDIIRRENRNPYPLPALPRTERERQQFPEAFQRFFRDHFALRSLLIRAHSVLLYHGLHSPPNQKAIAGKDGWLYVNSVLRDPHQRLADTLHTAPLSAPALQSIRDTYERRRRWMDERGIKYLVVFCPDKAAIYPEFFPAGHLCAPAPSVLDQLCTALQQSGIAVLDLRPALIAAKPRATLYYKTDTHWNSVGGFAAYREIAQALLGLGLPVRPLDWSDVVVEKVRLDAGLDLSAAFGLQRDLPEGECYLARLVRPPLSQPLEPPADAHRFVFRRTIDRPDLPTAIVFRDSYSDALIPFLSEHFRRIDYIWCHRHDQAFIEANRPDVVMDIVVERFARFNPRDWKIMPARLPDGTEKAGPQGEGGEDSPAATDSPPGP